MAESRLFIGAMCIGMIACFKKTWRNQLIPKKNEIPHIAVIGLFNSVVPFALFTYAMQYLNAGLGAILNSISPIWTGVIGAIWLKDHLDTSRKLGMVLGVAGIVYLMWGKAHFSTGGLGLPILASIAITMSYGFATNYIKVYGQGINRLGLTFMSLSIGSLMLAIPAIMNLPTEHLSFMVWLGILGLGVGSTAIAYLLFFRLIEDTGPSVAISVTFLVPVFSILWGDIFLDEQPNLQMIIGGLIIIVGTSLAVGLVKFPKKLANSTK
jgi:drug/metabolite transporter (DMT)-like permease